VKRSTLAILGSLGFLSAARALQRGRSVILTYHGVLSGSHDDYSYLNYNFVAAGTFDEQIRYLLEHYRPIGLAELVRCYTDRTPPPPRSVAITFDDGFANNYTVAFPILQKYSFPFTVFLTTGMIGAPGAQLWSERVKRAIYLCPKASVDLRILGQQHTSQLDSPTAREQATRRVLQVLKRATPAERDAALCEIESVCGRPELRADDMERYQFLTWNEARAMASAGVELGSHTVNHPILSTLDDRTLAEELSASKNEIEAQTGRECHTFAYPNGQPGDFGAREKRALQAAGYSCGLSLGGTLNPPRCDPFELDRINIGRQFDGPVYQAAVTGLLGTLRTMRRNLQSRRPVTNSPAVQGPPC
jgi:peptidoglycan/xylan/chitin deacetylase (PgdA/CDA1 family)